MNSKTRVVGLLLTFALQVATGQPIRTSVHNIGTIAWADSNEEVGTGFLLRKQCLVVTCSHVVGSRRCTYTPAQTNARISLKLVSDMPSLDLAIFKPDSCPSWDAFSLGCFDSIKAGDQITYAGWRVPENDLMISASTVLSKGIANSRRFLDFQGRGKPGYSGGPVLDSSGRVVAIMTQAWNQTLRQDSTQIIMNRAFSTDSLSAFLDSEHQPETH